MSEMTQKLKDLIAARLIALIQNPHTSGSAFVYGLLKAAGILWPNYKDKLDKVAEALIVYGLVMAGDSKPHTGNTSFWPNPASTTTPPPPKP